MVNVFIKNLTTSDIIELPFISLSFTDELNVGKDAKFVFDYNAIETIAEKYNTTPSFLLTSALTEVYIEKDGTKIYLGVISDYALSLNENGNKSLNVASVGYFTLLGKRRTDDKREFTATDAGTIAWTLIAESQASDNPYSDLGITQGTITASVDRDRTFRFENIKDEIVKMSNNNLDNGFDFEIDNSKVFNVYYPLKGSFRSDIFLDAGNIRGWTYRKPLVMSLANQVYVIGDGINDDVLYVLQEAGDEYKAVWKLLEERLDDRQIITSATLTDKGNKYLQNCRAPKVALTLTLSDEEPDIVNYEVGDYLKVNLPTLDINEIYLRVLKRSVSYDTNLLGTVSLVMEQ